MRATVVDGEYLAVRADQAHSCSQESEPEWSVDSKVIQVAGDNPVPPILVAASLRTGRQGSHAAPSLDDSPITTHFNTLTSVKTFGPRPVRHDAAHGVLTPARSHVLESLQQLDEPITASALAARLGHHANTVREHLDALVERGLATRSHAELHGRGRPAWRYSPSTQAREPDTRVRDYATLVYVLAEQIARSSRDPEADAIAAGRAWGRMLTKPPGRTSAASARKRTVRLLDEIGFDPDVDPRTHSLLLRRCPFLDVARLQSQVVCSAHQGMIAAAVDGFGGDGSTVQLRPFADPGGCIVNFGLSTSATTVETG